MKEIIGHLGTGFLELMGCIGIIVIIMALLNDGGILHEIVAAYMKSICG